MRLQDKLNEYKKSFLETAPPEAVEVVQRSTEDLKNSGILDKVLKVVEPAPEFSIANDETNEREIIITKRRLHHERISDLFK